jgi:hypothetical protein
MQIGNYFYVFVVKQEMHFCMLTSQIECARLDERPSVTHVQEIRRPAKITDDHTMSFCNLCSRSNVLNWYMNATFLQ